MCHPGWCLSEQALALPQRRRVQHRMVTSGVGVAASRFYDLAAPLLVRAVDRGPRLGDVHCCVQPRWYTRPPGMALTSLHKFDYELDWYQERARACLEAGASVLVEAPTSAGKTTVAPNAISLCLQGGGDCRCAYTTPIKALSTQRYVELARKFGAKNVCLMFLCPYDAPAPQRIHRVQEEKEMSDREFAYCSHNNNTAVEETPMVASRRSDAALTLFPLIAHRLTPATAALGRPGGRW